MLVIDRGFCSPSNLATAAHSAIRTNTETRTTSKYVHSFQKWSSGKYTTISQRKPRATALSIGSHKPGTTRKITMAWQDSTARAEVDVPLSAAWELWSDREGLNRWMPWIASIKVLKDQPEMSRWTLKYNAFGQDLEFSWLARNMQPIQYQKIHWRSVDGLPNRGAVRFYPRGPSSCGIELTVSYEVPAILAGTASIGKPLRESFLEVLLGILMHCSCFSLLAYAYEKRPCKTVEVQSYLQSIHSYWASCAWCLVGGDNSLGCHYKNIRV